MPTYEYVCQMCGQYIERFQKISAEPLRHCPACGEEGLQKQISAANFHLKGTGWYATDFRDQKQTDNQESQQSKSQQGEAQGGSQSDSQSSQQQTNSSQQAQSSQQTESAS